MELFLLLSTLISLLMTGPFVSPVYVGNFHEVVRYLYVENPHSSLEWGISALPPLLSANSALLGKNRQSALKNRQ